MVIVLPVKLRKYTSQGVVKPIRTMSDSKLLMFFAVVASAILQHFFWRA
jgi:hypothetical protein